MVNLLNHSYIRNDFVFRSHMINKLVVILGPTGAGKSVLAVKLAQRFSGEVISADSRQVYKGMDIGSGKITRTEMMGIPHHLLDVVSPRRKFSVAQYTKLALRAIRQIHKRGKLPFLVGGSPFYIYSLVDGIVIPQVEPNYRLRSRLEKLSTEELYQKLQSIDPQRAKTIELKNPRRLIRALEIVLESKKPVLSLQKNPLPCPILFLGIKKDKEELQKLISERLERRFRQGLVEEVDKLRGQGLSWKRLEEFGLEYRFIAQYLQGKVFFDGMKNSLQKATERFARRQMTWFKKDKRTHWVQGFQETNFLIKKFLAQE